MRVRMKIGNRKRFSSKRNSYLLKREKRLESHVLLER